MNQSSDVITCHEDLTDLLFSYIIMMIIFVLSDVGYTAYDLVNFYALQYDS